MAYVIRPDDRASFKRCRRQWDLSCRSRQNLERVEPACGVLDLEEAVRDALAVYYFPGMWEWNRAIVLPLVRNAFERSVARQVGSGTPTDDTAANRGLGLRLLEAYFAWAPSVDRFSPVRVETDFAAHVPDLARPGYDLASAAVGEVRYEGRIRMLVIDEAEAYWIVEHRLVTGAWTDLDLLLLDDEPVAACWAWERFYLGMRIAGTIITEIRIDLDLEPVTVPADAPAAAAGPGHRRMYVQAASEPSAALEQAGEGPFRRTQIPRSRRELDAMGERIALEALDMIDPGLWVYPNPSPEHCRACSYRAPCLVLTAGEDYRPMLADQYRERPPEEPEEGRLGGVTWGMNRGAMPLDSRAREGQRLHRRGADDDT
ncbi:MAG: hypothetical protein ACRDZO_09760 [Egibacteraceae bacterium]